MWTTSVSPQERFQVPGAPPSGMSPAQSPQRPSRARVGLALPWFPAEAACQADASRHSGEVQAELDGVVAALQQHAPNTYFRIETHAVQSFSTPLPLMLERVGLAAKRLKDQVDGLILILDPSRSSSLPGAFALCHCLKPHLTRCFLALVNVSVGDMLESLCSGALTLDKILLQSVLSCFGPQRVLSPSAAPIHLVRQLVGFVLNNALR